MSALKLPRYFVPSQSGSSVPAEAPEPAVDTHLEHCVDSFRMVSRRGVEDVIVGVNRTGDLSYVLGRASGDVSQRALRELALHELLSASANSLPARTIHAERLFLFELEFLEQVAGGQDLNQPLYAYGTLIGPVAENTQALRVRGQLTLTRGDLLEGFAIGNESAFRYAHEAPYARAAYHALLAGARAEETAQGEDLLLAYPLPPAELAEEDLENTAIVQLLIAELVEALQRDLERLERERGLLEKWFGTSRAALLAQPVTHDMASSMARVDAALRCLPEWPSARVNALRARIGTVDATHAKAPLSARVVAPSALGSASRPTTPAQPLPTMRSAPPRSEPAWQKPAAGPPAWTRDFLPEQHRGDPAASFVTWKALRAAKKPPERTDWMDDFRAPAASGVSQREPTQDEDQGKATRPDWMRDFDDE